jgi:hypothetical protein
MDSGQYVIIRMKKADLHKNIPIWCGLAWDGYGGTHLGIKNLKTQKVERGLVDIDGNYQGWGFGHYMYPQRGADAHSWAWAGETLGRTIFEIAVTADEPGSSERQALFEVK